MSTLRVTNIQHPNAEDPAIELSPSGGVLLSGAGDVPSGSTGAPWFLPYPEPGEAFGTQAVEDLADAVADGLSAAGNAFNASETITATDASWPVPSLGSPIVKVTVIGGGGGGGGSDAVNGGAGGTSTFNAGSAGTVTSAGGSGGNAGFQSLEGLVGTAGLASGNGGMSGGRRTTSPTIGHSGLGGAITVDYLDLTGITTVNVTIGSGGTGADDVENGGAGGRGEVIVEYEAA